MSAAAVLKSTLNLTNMVVQSYLSDLEDAELTIRPAEGCNCIAWQLGHLISANASLIEGVAPGTAPSLPDGFADRYTADTAASDDTAGYLSKDEYLALFSQIEAATLAAIENVTEEQLAAASPERFQPWAPTIGDVFALITTHAMMHVGQWVPVRRQLGKPVVI